MTKFQNWFSSTNHCGVSLGTEARVDAVALPVLAPGLEVERWIHLYEQPCPSLLVLKPDRVRGPLSIKRSTLNEVTTSLQSTN